MDYQIGYYVHHHGSGHLMRALAIASQLDAHVTLLGSGLKPYEHLIPQKITCVHLPMDVEDHQDQCYHDGTAVDVLHYAPLNVKGIRDRNQMLCNFFASSFPMIFIVDVSVEVALLARLCSIPTIVMRQHGHRNDPAHLAAYQSASLLIAPYARQLQSGSPTWVNDKSLFSGGFSKYTSAKYTVNEGDAKQVAVMCGKGGTSLSLAFLIHLAKSCPSYHFHGIGDMGETVACDLKNITLHGELKDPLNLLKNSSIIIGNAGHNTVMEVAELNKQFICVPEQRPYDEQLHKAEMIAAVHQVNIVLPADLYLTNWPKLLKNVEHKPINWEGMINESALHEIASTVHRLAVESFKSC